MLTFYFYVTFKLKFQQKTSVFTVLTAACKCGNTVIEIYIFISVVPTDVVSTNFGDAITTMTAVMAVMKAKIAKTNIVNAMKPANSPAPMPNVFPKIMLAMARMIVRLLGILLT